MNFGRGEVTGFQYATTLTTSAQWIITPFGTAAANLRKKVRITDIKASVGASARAIEIGGKGGELKKIGLTLPANSNPNYNFEMPYALEAISSTGVVTGIYASAAGAGVDIIISGYVERKS